MNTPQKPNKTQADAALRGILVVLIAALTALVAGLTAHVSALLLGCCVILQAAIALRAFVDTSVSDAQSQPAPDADPTTAP